MTDDAAEKPRTLVGERVPVRIGLVGCGVVGTGILQLLRDNRRAIEAAKTTPTNWPTAKAV